MAGGQQGRAAHDSRRSVLAAALIAVAVAALCLVAWLARAAVGEAAVARVTDADGTVRELPLDEDVTLTVTTDLGTNVVEVRDGRVRVREADCPHQDCVEQGWIDAAGQEIVCLPHRLYVEVVGADASDVDLTAGR